MIRRLSRLSLALATVALSACTANKPSPAGKSGEQKGQYGVSYFVSVSRPVGGTITSADGRIDCGTAGGTKNLCAPVSFAWGATATFTATPDHGQYFQSWAGDCSGAIASGVGGCSLNTVNYGADKWVVAVFNPPDQLGHSSIPDPAQHGPLFFDSIKGVSGAPTCTRCHGQDYDGVANAPSCTACHAAAGHANWLTDCGFCHGAPPATRIHPPSAGGLTGCIQCHPDTVLASGSINAASGKHMNGTGDFAASNCNTSCHAYPPSSGAHLAHYALAPTAGTSGYGDLSILQSRFRSSTPTTAPAVYAFGCGNCHPADSITHDDGKIDVTVARGAPGTMKGLNSATASFDTTARTCSGVYCHSSGQATPDFMLSPGWNSGVTLGCDGCHRNPPRYVSSGPGTAGGNSHFGVNIYGDPWGHVAGLPAPSVGIFKHGGWYGGGPGSGTNSSMVSCQTCHFDTTDPSNTGPSGFYYLDTTVDVDGTALGGWEGFFSCVGCHTPGSQTIPTRAGKVLPLRHVNGSREVKFDPRTSLPAFDWLPIPPDRPTKPYWFTVSSGVAEWDRTIVSWTRPPLGGTSGATAQFDLTAARYDPATKTCTNVGCHMSQGSTNFNPGGPVPLDPPRIPLVWGDVYYGNPWTCAKCHALDPAFAY
jgi:predicted CxxxxCH...CXXCH cytochrome family protein